MKKLLIISALVCCTATAATAQEKASGAARGATDGVGNVFGLASNFVLKAAEQFPAEKYGYKPTPEVRSFAALVGHVADANHMFCSIAEGKQQPPEDMGSEKLTDKAQLIAALKASIAHCNAVMANLTDADLTKSVKLFGNPSNVSTVVTMNAAHNYEHYGNIVTYMRLNGMVPPSSQQ